MYVQVHSCALVHTKYLTFTATLGGDAPNTDSIGIVPQSRSSEAQNKKDPPSPSPQAATNSNFETKKVQRFIYNISRK